MVFPFGGKSCRFIPFSKVLNRFKCKVNSRDTVMPIIFTIGWRPGEKIITIQKVDRQWIDKPAEKRHRVSRVTHSRNCTILLFFTCFLN